MTLRFERVRMDHPDAALLIAEVQAVYAERYGSGDDAPVEVDEFEGEQGRFFVAYLGDVPVATGAWRSRAVPADVVGERAAEIKRMFVRASHQRRGFARQVLAHVEDSARRAGVDALVLETGTMQPEAIALYVSAGYRLVAPFGHYSDSDLSRCYAKEFGRP